MNRKSKDGIQKTISCPMVLINYNENTNFVNNFDLLAHDYSLNRKIMKLYLRLQSFHFIDSAIINALITNKLKICLN